MKTVRNGAALMLLAVLSACASAPTDEVSPAPSAAAALPVVQVSAAQLADYWQADTELFPEGSSSGARNVQYGCVRVSFGIDAEGQVFDLTVEKSWPQNRFVAFVSDVLNDTDFDASENNAALQPVRTELLLTVVERDGSTTLQNVEHVKRFCQ